MMTSSATLSLSAATRKQIDALMREMTLSEKCSLLSGRDNWCTVAIPRLDLGYLIMTDGPHGVRPDVSSPLRVTGETTYFPTGVSMAATWNPELIRELGVALAEETRALGCDVLLGPCVNIVRSPLAGRNFESMSEDPFLAGRIAAGWVDGIQSQGVGASLKHFACNNQENDRFRGSSEVDERTLREIYLPQFEYVVKHCQPWTVMCSYNRINGTYASENTYLLNDILRREWGFEGLVVSDWGAVHSTVESVAAGLDLEMPGPAKYRLNLSETVANWQLSEEAVDASARRVLELLAKTGHLGKDGHVIKGSANTKAHHQLARKVAAEAITLLKNDGGLLPLPAGKLRSLAVIGEPAFCTPQGGGSSTISSPHRVASLDAIRKLVGSKVNIKAEYGCKLSHLATPVDLKLLSTPDGKPGIQAEYYDHADWSGKPYGTRVETTSDLWWFGAAEQAIIPGLPFGSFSGRWTAILTAEATETVKFCFDIQGSGRMLLDGKLLFRTHPYQPEACWGTGSAEVRLMKGRKYEFVMEFVKSPEAMPCHIKFYTEELDTAVKTPREYGQLAASCDAAIVFVEYGEGVESEGSDRPDMKLPGNQDAIVAAVCRANPRTIVVVNTGTPVEMPWADQVPAILQAYYSGQEGGNAIADILFGKVNPSGKLASSYPKRLEDNPSYLHFMGGRQVHYGEGVFVGYRYYDTKKLAPLFPFGHGLSYTTFEYTKLQLPKTAAAGELVTVQATVKNVGKMAGQEVVQLYVSDREASVRRPVKELKGFVKIALKPGESRIVKFELDARAFAFYDVIARNWKVEPGKFDLLVGSSSRDIRLQGTIDLK